MARRLKSGLAVEYSGPLFTKDPRKQFRANARDFVSAIAEDGEGLVKAELTLGHGRLTGRYADAVEGRARSLAGKKWALTAVVTSTRHLQMPNFRGYGTFLESGKRGKVQTTFPGLWVYKRVASLLRRRSKAARADLTKGLN
jgi:hypothetical protein